MVDGDWGKEKWGATDNGYGGYENVLEVGSGKGCTSL